MIEFQKLNWNLQLSSINYLPSSNNHTPTIPRQWKRTSNQVKLLTGHILKNTVILIKKGWDLDLVNCTG